MLRGARTLVSKEAPHAWRLTIANRNADRWIVVLNVVGYIDRRRRWPICSASLNGLCTRNRLSLFRDTNPNRNIEEIRFVYGPLIRNAVYKRQLNFSIEYTFLSVCLVLRTQGQEEGRKLTIFCTTSPFRPYKNK